MPVITTFQVRRGTAAQWTSVNPVLAAGEEGYETDTRRSKHGDGTSPWNSLPYDTASGSTGNIDGGKASAVYGGTTGINGGTASTIF